MAQYPPNYPYAPVPAYPPVEIDNRPFWEKYKYIIIGAGALIMLVVLGLVIKAIIDADTRRKATPKAAEYEMITNPETGEAQVVNDPLEGYDPTPLAKRLVDAFAFSLLGWTGWGNSTRCDTTYEANNLSTNKLIAVALKYKQLNTDRKVSLFTDLETSQFDGCWATDYSYVLKERLQKEGITN